MPAPRIAKTALVHVRPPREGMDRKHLDNLRGLPCLGCGTDFHFVVGPAAPGHGNKIPGNNAHHLLRTGEHGISRKSADRWAVPLCFSCHDGRVGGSLHHDGDEDAWFSARGIDARAVASALWSARGDPEAMYRIIFRARQDAALKAAAMRETTP